MRGRHRMHIRRSLSIALFIILPALSRAAPTTLPLERIDDWQRHSFVGESTYRWQQDDGALCMESHGTASARIWEAEPPWPLASRLSWQWQPGEVISDLDRRSREGDDFPGRVYIAVRHPIVFWQSRVLVYVHASDIPVDSHWPNPFTDRFHMWVVSTGGDKTWHSIERNVADDWETAFGDRPERFHAIGLMADSDNSGQSTRLCLKGLSVETAQ